MARDTFGHCFLGVDYSIAPYELPPGALADSLNIVPNNKGLPTGRGGSVKLNSTSLASRITSFHEFRSGAATRNKLCSYATKIAYYNAGTGEFVDSITGLTTGKMLQWVNFAGKAICVNEGSDAPQYWSGSGTSGALAGSPPNGLTVSEWGNRLWFGGDATNVATLTGSALNDPTDYSTSGDAGYFSGTVGDSKDPITGLFGFFDMLLIGKKNNIYKMTSTSGNTSATSTLAIEPLYSKNTDNIGFTSPWAITQVGNDVIFLDGFDIKRLSGIQEFGDVSHASIIPHFREYLENICDADYLQYSQFFHYKKQQQIWVSMPTGATTHFVFVLDYKFLPQTGRYAFYPMGSLAANTFGGVENGQVDDIYYGDETGFVHQLDIGDNDNGSAINRYFVNIFHGNTKQMAENGIVSNHEIRKHFKSAELYILPTQASLSFTINYAFDLHDDTQIRTSGNYTALTAEDVTGWQGTGVKFTHYPFNGFSGRTMALKVRHNTVAENFIFYPSSLEYTYKSRAIIA